MAIQKFKHYLYRGMGAAILKLQENPREAYKKTVLYACTHHTKYDGQGEPDRADYLYKALKFFKDDEWFIEKISKVLWQTREIFLTIQLVNILMLLSKDGYKERVIDELQRRLYQYFIELPKENWIDWHDGRESAEYLMTNLYQLMGVSFFWATMDLISQRLINCIEEDAAIFFYDELIVAVLEDQQLKKAELLAQQYGIKDEGILKLLIQFDGAVSTQTIEYRESDIFQKLDNMSMETFLEYIAKRVHVPDSFIKHFLKGKIVNKEVLKGLALSYLTSHERRQVALMRIFTFVDFPFGVADLLFHLAKANDDSMTTIYLYEALARFSDPKVRALALENFARGSRIIESLRLSCKTVTQTDIPLLARILRDHRDKDHDYDEKTESNDFYDFHELMQEYLRLMEANPSIDFGNIYKLLLDRHLCATCRKHLVEILCANEHALNHLLFIKTCVEDSHEDTRLIATAFLENYYASLV